MESVSWSDQGWAGPWGKGVTHSRLYAIGGGGGGVVKFPFRNRIIPVYILFTLHAKPFFFLELESFSPTPLRSGGLVRAAGSSPGG
jgi:hypothetical protein